ncbi:MAG: aminotransferase class I/II-fold pyridoxal phosphate-dependent enzyme [Proteobacteria bacterium]|nr:aminotransferase class I/II-fold pyridoxal phosphate-dependent enzyme [Pseudomonadota bacterium]
MNLAAQAPVQSLAQELNQALEDAAPEVLGMLSPLGRRLYYPRGILSQTAEAKTKAHRYNATIGIATEGGGPMYLASLHRWLHELAPSQAYSYAPPGGQPELRALWRDKLLADSPSLRGKVFGQPLVTSAITHGLSLVGDLFVEAGDRIVIPDKLWGNYRLTYEVRLGAELWTFPTFQARGLNTQGLEECLGQAARGRDKVLALLNFPNNPTGYMPTPEEGDRIARAMIEQARQGTKVVVVCDDAYHGLFYHLGGRSLTESLFGRLTNAHPNLLAIKLDGATKELFAWGLRCGFLTFGPGRCERADAVVAALDAKVRGATRAVISNSPQLSQSLVHKALMAPEIRSQRQEKQRVLLARATKVHEIVHDRRFRDSWEAYPFNSGYFMCLRIKGVDAHKLRLHLLDTEGIGLISASASDLRVAFSCLELDQIAPLFETLHRTIGRMQAAAPPGQA